MKRIYIPILLALAACTGQPPKDTATPTADTTQKPKATAPASPPAATNNNETNWMGQLNGKVPVFLHYSEQNNDIIAGEITYLNTKDKLPIRVFGSKDQDGNLRLLEFESSGNISGIITGKPDGKVFKGEWFSPKTRKVLTLALQAKDTVVASLHMEADMNKVAGRYYYAYGEEGPEGSVEIAKAGNGKISFSVSAVTGAPARNIADVEEDTVALSGSNFTYVVPESDNCGFKVQFYKDCIKIDYTNGYCDGQFGHNATVEGIFIKVK